MDHQLFALDMERQYEDDSFVLDPINSELQLVSAQQLEQHIDDVYSDWLASMMEKFYSLYSYEE